MSEESPASDSVPEPNLPPEPAPVPAAGPPTPAPERPKPKKSEPPARVFLVPYPKIVFLYPIFVVAFVAAVIMSFVGENPESKTAIVVSTVFLAVFAVNLVVLAFDFPRTTSLTYFFLAAAVVMGLVLVFKFKPDWLPAVTAVLAGFHPWANATFYWTVACVLAIIFTVVYVETRFDYWEVRPNELLHHHGILSNLERMSAPNLRIDKEINDVFEYLLLRSGRLILQTSSERRAIVLENVPFISQKEAAITQMLGALQVQIRKDSSGE